MIKITYRDGTIRIIKQHNSVDWGRDMFEGGRVLEIDSRLVKEGKLIIPFDVIKEVQMT